jgi:hypothetical protein
MRLQQYIKESKDIKPKTKKFSFIWDNPMGSWLENERKGARKGRWGSVTGRFGDFMQIPTKMVANLKGKQGENRKLTDPEVIELKASIEKYGLHSPVFINVEYDGHAEINEGNRRTLIAKTLGWKYIPVEIVYYAGGELINGPWHPDKIVKVAKPWRKPKTKLPQPKPKKKREFVPYDKEYVNKEREKRKKERLELEKELEGVDPEILDLIFGKKW